jgi:hypothetical protein
MAAMSVKTWDIDQAVTRGPLDEELEGCCSFDRYGVTECEEVAGEPLAVALAQEERDVAGFTGSDDQWVFVEHEDADWSLEILAGDGPEARAMHVVSP